MFQAKTEAQGRPANNLFGPLVIRDFRLLWIGETISVAGSQLHLVALPWLVLQLTGSGAALGVVMMAAAVPRALLMLVGGVVTDRYSPRSIMVASNLVRGVLAAAVGLLIISGSLQLWQLVGIALLFGTSDAFFYPAFSSIVPKLVPEHQLSRSNALLQASAQGAAVSVPAAGGVLIAAAGAAPAFLADAGSFLVSAALLMRVRGGIRRPVQAGRTTAAQAMLAELRDGFAYAWLEPVIRGLLLVAASLNFAFVGPFVVGTAALAHQEFDGAAALGVMYSALGGGALAGTILAGSLRRFSSRGRAILGLLMVVATGLFGLSAVRSVASAAVIIAVVGTIAGFGNVFILTLLQTRAEPAMLGRVMSLVMFSAVGLTPFSYALAGAAVELGPRIMFLVAGALLLPLTGVAAHNRELRRLQ